MVGFLIGLGTVLLTGQSILGKLGLGCSTSTGYAVAITVVIALVVVLTGMTTDVLTRTSYLAQRNR
ncbi:hypothetical protein [Cyanobium sp. Aljojuca 7D2]|uniref:hypothetical protein n=1 Tax=Cyanobium sp. Aljojuca 7D2 TaxID=2823698 RepID=UPI0039657816